MLDTAAVGALGGVLVLASNKLLEWLRARTEAGLASGKAQAAVNESVAGQAVAIYREITESLRTDLRDMAQSLHVLEEDRVKCREEAATLRAEVKSLRDHVAAIVPALPPP